MIDPVSSIAPVIARLAPDKPVSTISRMAGRSPTSPITTSTPALYLGAAEAGLGLAYCHEGEVFDALASGRLVSVLDDWSPSFAGFNLFYPGRHQLGQGLRALIDMLKEYHRIR